MKYLEIVADTNDADYVSNREKITDKQLEEFMPLIKAIGNFKPYTTQKRDSIGNFKWKHSHNFPTGECLREDLGEKSPKEIYRDVVRESVFMDFLDNYVPTHEYGIHTIKSIEIFEINNKQQLL